MKKHPSLVPEITLPMKKKKNGEYYLHYDKEQERWLGEPRLRVKIQREDRKEWVYPIFQQNAGLYEEYSDYMKMHGCACCSLTTVLGALGQDHCGILPQNTIRDVEKQYFSSEEYEKNYGKSLRHQMPVTLYGIHKILTEEGIANQYRGAYEEKRAYKEIIGHLYSGQPVIFETSRLRHKGRWIVRLNDKKYAGSYHTMVMLGIDQEGYVIFTDSATRSWAGKVQRLKRAKLEELLTYMFPQKDTSDSHVYFHGRRGTGGYILVEIL